MTEAAVQSPKGASRTNTLPMYTEASFQETGRLIPQSFVLAQSRMLQEMDLSIRQIFFGFFTDGESGTTSTAETPT